MRIGGAIAIIATIISISAAAWADDPTDSWPPQNVRVNFYVSEIAEVTIEGDVHFQEDFEDFVEIWGDAPISAIANFDYQLHFHWIPDDEWTYETFLDRSYVGEPAPSPSYEPLPNPDGYDALEAVEGVIRVAATQETVEPETPTITPGVTEESTSVWYGETFAGTVFVTLTHR